MINLGKENEQIEYKKSTGELDDAMKSISAILNKHGKGKILFGVKPNGDVIGQQISESTLRDISRKISDENIIIESIKNDGSITTTELSNLLGKSRKTIQNIINNLKKQGKIERIGSNKTGYWKIKE